MVSLEDSQRALDEEGLSFDDVCFWQIVAFDRAVLGFTCIHSLACYLPAFTGLHVIYHMYQLSSGHNYFF